MRIAIIGGGGMLGQKLARALAARGTLRGKPIGHLALADIDFAPVYRRVAALPELQPGDVLASDRVLHRGSGQYHRRAGTAAGA